MEGTISICAKLIKIQHRFLDPHTETTIQWIELFKLELK